MKDQISITVKDGGIDKTFLIKKPKAMAAFNLFMDINRIIEKSEGMYAAVAQQFLHNCMQTGTQVAGVTNTEVENVIKQNSESLLYFVFNSFFKELDADSRNNILEQIFINVIFKNGVLDTALTVLPNSNRAEHVDMYITEVSTIFTICREFMRFNFGHFLPQEAKTNSPESPVES